MAIDLNKQIKLEYTESTLAPVENAQGVVQRTAIVNKGDKVYVVFDIKTDDGAVYTDMTTLTEANQDAATTALRLRTRDLFHQTSLEGDFDTVQAIVDGLNRLKKQAAKFKFNASLVENTDKLLRFDYTDYSA